MVVVIVGLLLRFIDVSNDPPGLYVDEVSIGYNAYQILTTGKDEYGIAHPLWFRSYGDYKLPVYIYMVAGSMAIFGKTEFAVRFPSLIAGILTIPLFYLFLEKLVCLEKDTVLRKRLTYVPLLASFLLAISSWHIQFSRGGFEITVGTLFYLLGVYLFIMWLEKKKTWSILVSVLSFILAMYTYHTFRILSPLALLFIAYREKVYKHPKTLPAILAVVVLCLPIILFTLSPHGSERFSATSAFAQLKMTNIWQQLINYPLLFLSNYLSFFSFDFLFSFGDGIGRHQIPLFGELYRWQLPFFLAGIYFLLRQKKSIIKNTTLLLFLTAPLAGALAVPSPHALRSLPLVIPCMVLIAIGVVFIIQKIHRFKIVLLSLLIIIATYEFLFYLHFYYVHYPQVNQLDWGAGYKGIVQATSQQKSKYTYIVVDDVLNYAPEYFHFYDPSIRYMMVSESWQKPKKWGDAPVLYIRPFYGQRTGKDLVANIYLKGINHDIYAQLWEIK